MTDVVALFGKKIFLKNKLIFWNNANFEKSKKIHNHSPKYYANLRYTIELRIQKLREIWMLL